MDSVYGVYNKHSSEKINLKTYFEDYKQQLTDMQEFRRIHSFAGEKNAFIGAMQTKFSDEDFFALSEYCSVENLTVPGEASKCSDACTANRKDIYDKVGIPNEGLSLETLTELQKRLKKDQKSFIQHLKYRSDRIIKPEDTETNGHHLQPEEEILVYIRFYSPFNHHSRCQNTMMVPKVKMSHVIVMLGSQTLDQLRDKINCTSDLLIPTDISEDPHREVGQSAKNVYKSGFFYIEGTFYNDFRDPSNLDYSQVIRDWAKNKNLGPFRTSTMEGIRIDSLSVRFGFPWVYQHQGSCEHLFMFSDARLIHPSDTLAVVSYPRIHTMKACPTRYCMMCGILAARWITTGHDRLPHDPCYFCEVCFHSYNYVDGKKVGEFKAYPFPSNADVSQEDGPASLRI